MISTLELRRCTLHYTIACYICSSIVNIHCTLKYLFKGSLSAAENENKDSNSTSKEMGAGVGGLYIFASVATYILTHCFDICFIVVFL